MNISKELTVNKPAILKIFSLACLLVLTLGLNLGAQSTNKLSVLSMETIGEEIDLKIDLSDLDAIALEELASNREEILSKYPSFKSLDIDRKSKEAHAVIRSGELGEEDLVQVLQTQITSAEDRALRDRLREEVRSNKSNQH